MKDLTNDRWVASMEGDRLAIALDEYMKRFHPNMGTMEAYACKYGLLIGFIGVNVPFVDYLVEMLERKCEE